MEDEKEFDWKAKLKECLDSTTVAVLATRERDGVWATPVYFSYDDEFNFYFISPKGTRHMNNIKSNSNVALAVFTPLSVSGIHQIGVQVKGVTSIVPDSEIEKVYAIRAKRLSGDLNWISESQEGHFVKEHGGIFVKITPTMMIYVDTRYFGGQGRQVPLAKLV